MVRVLILRVKRVSLSAKITTKASPHSESLDLYSAENLTFNSNEVKVVLTDIAMKILNGYNGKIAPWSGLASQFIDIGGNVVVSDYRGIVKIIGYNFSSTPFEIDVVDKIAQKIITKIASPILVKDTNLSLTDRGANNFGSSGSA